MIKLIRLIVFFLFPFLSISQQDGSLIKSFGNDGICLYGITGKDLKISDASELSDGSVIVSGSCKKPGQLHDDFILAKITRDGLPDTSFGVRFYDYMKTENISRALVVNSDKSMVLCGWTRNINHFDILLIKVGPAGEIDTTFGDKKGCKVIDVSQTDKGIGIVLDENDNIIVCGETLKNGRRILLAKLDKNGRFVDDFGQNGISVFTLSSAIPSDIKITESGTLYVAADIQINGSRNSSVVKLFPDGQPDIHFGKNGISGIPGYIIGSTSSVAVGKDNGRLLLSGSERFTGDFYSGSVIQILANGEVDTTFGDKGKLLYKSFDGNNYNTDAQYVDDGSIISLGYGRGTFGSDIFLTKFTSNGQSDLSFGSFGQVHTDFKLRDETSAKLLTLNDGNLLATGYSSTDNVFFAAKYSYPSTSSLKQDEFSKPVLYPNPGTGHSLQIRSEEKVHGFRIYDLAGRLIHEVNGHNYQNQDILPKGMYLVEILYTNHTECVKWFVKQD